MNGTERKTHLSLFSGIGGLDLAAEAAGFVTVGQCEQADFPTKVLEKHWPDVPRWRDIRELTREGFHEKTGRWTINLISGGFPCQPFSTAGKRRSREDDRFLWPEMLRVIQELRPDWVCGENVAGIINLALDDCIIDLEKQGYTVQTLLLPACAVDAPHRRDRIAILAYADRIGSDARRPAFQIRHGKHETFVCGGDDVGHAASEGLPDRTGKSLGGYGTPESEPERPSSPVSHPDPVRCDLRRHQRQGIHGKEPPRNETNSGGENLPDLRPDERAGEQRTTQPGLGGDPDGFSVWMDGIRAGWRDGSWEVGIPRIARGVPDRVNRLKALGNAVVPAQFYPIFKAIMDSYKQEDFT